MNIALLGGDARQARLAELFAKDGHRVRVFGMEKLYIYNIYTAGTAEDAAAEADAAVLPLPATADGRTLNAPHAAREISIAEALDAVPPGCPVFAGRVPEEMIAAAEARGLRLVDYLRREELAVLNANATAEAALRILMEARKVTLTDTRALVIGFGRIGKLLALKLRALGVAVTVSARKPEDFAWIRALGLGIADTRALGGTLGGYGIVVNTVPAPVLGKDLLAELAGDCFCLDLASKPGGVDADAAAELGVHAAQALSLPGKAVPDSAAAIIRDTIYNILSE